MMRLAEGRWAAGDQTKRKQSGHLLREGALRSVTLSFVRLHTGLCRLKFASFVRNGGRTRGEMQLFGVTEPVIANSNTAATATVTPSESPGDVIDLDVFNSCFSWLVCVQTLVTQRRKVTPASVCQCQRDSPRVCKVCGRYLSICV